MKFENAVYPTKEQIMGFFEEGKNETIYMVNLLKFKEKAEYEDGRKTDLSGVQAYKIYGEAVEQLLETLGGSFVFGGNVERLMLGEVEELWDMVAIASYPSRAAMMEMMQSSEMQEISVHRTAGLAGQLNIETTNKLY
ncbi:DUF1330 domain-containing protein [Alphaproteobacteria bacterium]|nr:DUF1330 domain-containing protein [Alphaproteobacteria bacterium]